MWQPMAEDSSRDFRKDGSNGGVAHLNLFKAIEYKINLFRTQISTSKVRRCNFLEIIGPESARG